jgi:hypothetical protein
MHPILDQTEFRRDLGVARTLERLLVEALPEDKKARNLASTAGLPLGDLDTSGPPSAIWTNLLNLAARSGRLRALFEVIEQENVHPRVKAAIEAVRNVDGGGGALDLGRLLLEGGQPFLGRTNLRSVLPDLGNWGAGAAILLVRGPPDSGRTFTQDLIHQQYPKDPLVYFADDSTRARVVRRVWRVAAGNPAELPPEYTSEAGSNKDFWMDVLYLLERNALRLWVLFDDLDLGDDVSGTRALAEALAEQLNGADFVRHFRLVLLGYPLLRKPPPKISLTRIRDDLTEDLGQSHVSAFVDYSWTLRGVKFAPSSLEEMAQSLFERARQRAKDGASITVAVSEELRRWHQEGR